MQQELILDHMKPGGQEESENQVCAFGALDGRNSRYPCQHTMHSLDFKVFPGVTGLFL